MPTTNARVREAYDDHRIIRELDSDPDSPDDGAMWYRTDLDELRVQIGGATHTVDTTAV